MIKAPFGTLSLGLGMRGNANLINPETTAFVERVIADGGTVEDVNFLNQFISDAKANNYSDDIVAAYSPSWGVKGGATASDLYSITGASSDIVQAVGANQPTISLADLVGKTRLTFDGTADFLKSGAFTFNQPETVILGGFQQVSWTGGDRLMDGLNNTTMQLSQAGSSPAIGVNAGAFFSGPTIPVATDVHARYLFNGASSAGQRDAVAEVTGDAGTNNAGGFTLGSIGDGGSSWANIKVGLVILLSSAVDGNYATKMTAIYNFSKSAYGTP
ncbi:hypothetical protein KAR91_09070 [Candidatus Pacearchaeota archaeon]|nr:hypothetical protein [Candidatus Pacearchaeota archaeon]